MSISGILLALWFVLFGANGLFSLGLSDKFIFLLAFIVGLALLFEGYVAPRIK